MIVKPAGTRSDPRIRVIRLPENGGMGAALNVALDASTAGLIAYLRSRPEVGGLKVYRNGIIHIDNGERRNW